MIKLLCLLALIHVSVAQLTKADLTQGHVSLESSEKLWTTSWLREWLDLEPYLEEGFEVRIIDEDLVRKFIRDGDFQKSVVDPQGYLEADTADAIEAIVARHKQLSKLPLSVFICGGEQNLAVSVKELYTMAKSDERGVLLVYYVNHPLRADGHVGLGDVGAVSRYEIQELFSKSGRTANETIERNNQLLVCLEEVSKRLYWIEREYPLDKNLAKTDTRVDDDLADDAGVGGDLTKSDKIKQNVMGWREELATLGSWVFPALLSFIGLCLILAGMLIFHRKRVLTFPEINTSPRLGAENGALSSEKIRFKNANESLSAQKNKYTISEL